MAKKKKTAVPPGGINRQVATTSIASKKPIVKKRETSADNAIDSSGTNSKTPTGSTNETPTDAVEVEKKLDFDLHERTYSQAKSSTEKFYRPGVPKFTESVLPSNIDPLKEGLRDFLRAGIVDEKITLQSLYSSLAKSQSMDVKDEDFFECIKTEGRIETIEWLAATRKMDAYVEDIAQKKRDDEEIRAALVKEKRDKEEEKRLQKEAAAAKTNIENDEETAPELGVVKEPLTEKVEEGLGLGDMFDVDAQKNDERVYETTKILFFENPKGWTAPAPSELIKSVCKCTITAEKGKGGFIATLRTLPDQNVYTSLVCKTKLNSMDYAAVMAMLDHDLKNMFIRLAPCWKDLWTQTIDEKENKRKGELMELFKKVEDTISVVSNNKENASQVSSKAPTQAKQYRVRPNVISTVKNRLEGSEFNIRRQERENLPVMRHIAEITDAIERCPVVVLSSSTGSGKSTQVPVEILRDSLKNNENLSNILVAQPKRISATTIAERVSYEVCDSAVGDIVGYKIRMQNKTSPNTRITFMTNGVLLRMLASDTLLNGITHVIIDEVHERTSEIDAILYCLRNILTTRSDLRVILMSATTEIESLKNYFGNYTRILSIEQEPLYSIDVKYLDDLHEFLEEEDDEEYFSSKSESEIDEEEDEKEEAEEAKQLERRSYNSDKPQLRAAEIEDIAAIRNYKRNKGSVRLDLIYHLLLKLIGGQRSTILVFLPGILEIRTLQSLLDSTNISLMILHGDSDPEPDLLKNLSITKVILSTDIAETGVTIPDVDYIVDSGYVNEIRYIPSQNMGALKSVRISKASAMQRRGRAGRTKNGTCFHLFTAETFVHMSDQRIPEIRRTALHDVYTSLLRLFNGGVDNVLENFITAPDKGSIRNTNIFLRQTGIIDESGRMTKLGEIVAELPLSPPDAKALVAACKLRCLDDFLTYAAIISGPQSPFVKKLKSIHNAPSHTASDEFIAMCEARTTAYNIFQQGYSKRECRSKLAMLGISLDTILDIERYRRDLLNNLKSAGLLGDVDMDNIMIRRGDMRFTVCPPELTQYESHSVNSYLIGISNYPRFIFNYKREHLRMLCSDMDVKYRSRILGQRDLEQNAIYTTSNLRIMTKPKMHALVDNLVKIPVGIAALVVQHLDIFYNNGILYDTLGRFAITFHKIPGHDSIGCLSLQNYSNLLVLDRIALFILFKRKLDMCLFGTGNQPSTLPVNIRSKISNEDLTSFKRFIETMA